MTVHNCSTQLHSTAQNNCDYLSSRPSDSAHGSDVDCVHMQETIDRYRRSEGYTTDEVRLPSNATLQRLWKLFEYPETSRAGFVIALLSVTITLVSIVLFCIETLPAFATTHCVKDEAPNFLDPFFVIETTCTAWYTLCILSRTFI